VEVLGLLKPVRPEFINRIDETSAENGSEITKIMAGEICD
jgi:hypothetical protein